MKNVNALNQYTSISNFVSFAPSCEIHPHYDAFGNTIAKGGDMVDVLHFWFSTKYLDHDTGLYYYGYRYYSSLLQRWINRDPIEEEGGVNMYGFVNNDPINIYDTLGLMPATTWGGGGTGDYAQLLTALIDFLNGGPPVTYEYQYPDSVTKRLLNHAAVRPAWEAFKTASCADQGKGYPIVIPVSHIANTLDFFVDLKTVWGVLDIFGNLNLENLKYMDFGTRILGSFGGVATISVNCNTCERTLEMTLRDSFTVESMFRIPMTRNPTIKTPFLNPVHMVFNYNIKEKINGK